MGARGALFRGKALYDHPGTEELFVQAMRENCAFQYARCPEYRAILDQAGFRPEQLQGPEDLGELPPIPTLYFKRHHLSSMAGKHALFHTTSSGTSGRRSEVNFDFGALLCDLAMSLRACGTHGLISPRPTRYVILGYQPHRGNHMGVMKSAFLSTFLAPAVKRTYALRFREGEYRLDQEGLVEELRRCARQRHPVRLIGFPSYLHFLMQELEHRGLRFPMPSGSKILLGGGWKQFYRQQVDKPQLYAEVKERLDIPEAAIHEVFSVVEHPIIYWDCPRHHFHIPVYSRVLIRDVRTLKPLPYGQPGLVNLMTPLLKSAPLMSILTDDLGVLHPGESCGCGCAAAWLEVLGRVGMTEIKTCAAGAEEYQRGERE